MRLLSEKSDAIEHLFGASAGGIEFRLQLVILLLETTHARRELEANRSALVRFQLLDAGLSSQSPTAKAGELVGQVAYERSQFAHSLVFNSFVV